jgi:pilus assembly protein CpaB
MPRWIVIGSAVVLAALGTFLLVSYVQHAEERAREGQELARVLVVTEPIRQGTLAEMIGSSVAEREIPVDVLADDAVTDVEELSGLVATTDLVPGEQVIASRFQTPAAVAASSRFDVPPELLQVTIALDPARAVGGRLVPGDVVAVVASFDPFDLGAVEPGDPIALEEALDSIVVIGSPEEGTQSPFALQTPNSTHIIIHKVLVTGLQLEQEPRETPEGSLAVEYAPTGNLLITLAAPAEAVERIVFTAEHGFVWLALENADAPEPDTDIRTRENIYR